MCDSNPSRYERRSGKRPAKGSKGKTIAFSWTKIDINQGQKLKDWEEEGLLSQLCEMMREIGNYEVP